MKIKVSYIKSLWLLTMVWMSVGLNAQYEQDIISIGERTLEVREAFKISDTPQFKDTVIVADSLKYNIMSKVVPTQYETQDLKAAKVKVQNPLKRLYRGYVKAGAGSYTTPFFDGHFNSLRSKDWAYGASYRHLSSNGGINDVAHSAYAQNEAGIWARRSLKKHTASAYLDFDTDKVHFYGFDPKDIDYDNDDIKQRLNTFKINTQLRSYYSDSSRVNHTINMGYRRSSDLWESTEGNFLLEGDIYTYSGDYKFMLGTRLDINAYNSEQLMPLDFLNIEDPELEHVSSQNNTIFELSPQINTVWGDLRANVGLGIAFDMGSSTAVRFMPRAYGKYSLFSDLFHLYAGIDGSVDRNSYYSLYQENPFLQNELKISNTYNKIVLYGGVRGSISNELSFNGKVSFRSFSDLPLFINVDTTYSLANRFDVIYDGGTSTSIKGEVTYDSQDKLKGYASMELIGYSLEDQEEAWHLPTTVFSVGASYNLLNKFILSADVTANGKRKAATFIGDEGDTPNEQGYFVKELKGFVDGSLKMEYRYTKRLSAFVQFNNLTGGRYNRWNNYPVQRLMILGGLTYSF